MWPQASRSEIRTPDDLMSFNTRCSRQKTGFAALEEHNWHAKGETK
jgi:hypothetical protein